jgi:hypothetical protein
LLSWPERANREYNTVDIIQDAKKFCQVALRGAVEANVVVKTRAMLPVSPRICKAMKTESKAMCSTGFAY